MKHSKVALFAVLCAGYGIVATGSRAEVEADAADPHDDSYSAVLQAAVSGDVNSLRSLKGEVSRQGRGKGGGEDGREPLHESARRGHVEVVRILLQRGADIDSVDRMGRTALMDAAWEGHPAVVKALLEAGADATIENHGGGTALKVAMRKKGDTERQAEVIRLLRDHLSKLPEDGRQREEKLKWHGDPDWKWPGGQGLEL
jgi:ankyrin repeat protein